MDARCAFFFTKNFIKYQVQPLLDVVEIHNAIMFDLYTGLPCSVGSKKIYIYTVAL